MTQLVFAGRIVPDSSLLHDLVHAGYAITLMPQVAAGNGIGSSRNVMLIASLEEHASAVRAAQQLHRPGIPWLAWNRSDDQSLTLLAYAAGAAAVLPRDLSAQTLLRTLASILGPGAPRFERRAPFSAVQRRFRRGFAIELEPNMLIEIGRGVIAQSMVHADGVEVLLGMYGPGQVLPGHPDDTCAIQLSAHTDVVATFHDWSAVITEPAFMDRLRMRILVMEAWAAIQARPYLDDRILGLLELLAEQFGVPCTEGQLIDLRLTHAQLATAVGATRSTVTRLLRELRVRGAVVTIGAGERERFCLRHWHGGAHVSGPSVAQNVVLVSPKPRAKAS